MYTRPNIIEGCAYAEVLLGNPKAQRSFNFGTSAAVRPAAAALWKRVFCVSTPQPLQPGRFTACSSGGFDGQRFGILSASPEPAAPRRWPEMVSATARF